MGNFIAIFDGADLMPAKQRPSQMKALRSAAARKGWQTRRSKESDANIAAAMERHREARQASMRPFMRSAEPVQSHPAPWHPKPFLHRLWSKLVGR